MNGTFRKGAVLPFIISAAFAVVADESCKFPALFSFYACRNGKCVLDYQNPERRLLKK
jgi:hypothetical protein